MATKKDEKPKVQKKSIPGYMQFLIGGSSGMLAICVVQPMDLTKTRMQLMGPKAKASILGTISGIIKNEGIKGMYKGLTAALFRQATYTTSRLGVFNLSMDKYKENIGTPSYASKLLLGIMAGGVGAFFGNPAEVCLIRMTADGRLPKDQRRNYTHVFNALARIIKEEGVLTLWKGTSATVSRAMVVNSAQLGTYQQAREMLAVYLADGIFLHFCSSMISGLVTVLASQPLDIVKTRVQNASKGENVGVAGTFVSTLKKEGVFAFWKGWIPTYFKIGPHTVLTFIIMEQLNLLYFKFS